MPLSTCRELARHSDRGARQEYTCLHDRQQLLESLTTDYVVFDKIWNEGPSTGGSSANKLPISVFSNISMTASVKCRKKNICREQSKGKAHPITVHEGPEGEL